jgi:endonuclease I
VKECQTCHELLDENQFQFRPHSGTYRTSCRKCENKARYNRGRSEASKQQIKTSRAARFKQQRLDPEQRAKFIIYDSRKYDKRKNLENDLTRDVVKDMIMKGCEYCGNHEDMTLDRIDNSIGHLVSNILPACYRCNIMRSNMPYDAWLNIVPAIRDTFEKGLFTSWTAIGPRRKRMAD